MKKHYLFCSVILMIISISSGFSQLQYPELQYPDSTPPWTPEDSNYPYAISDASHTYVANAYVKTSGEFDKPFIFVEGIDFESYAFTNGNYSTELDQSGNWIRNGTFGWKAFTSQDLNNYEFLDYMDDFLIEIYNQGYDIVLVDFFNGADYIENNALVLEEILRKVNSHKVGCEEVVVAGASMGGQVSRVALRNMELNNEDPNVRLWVSLDSPHEGASVPLGLQTTISFFAQHGTSSAQTSAQSFLTDKLNRPAAQQMLLEHYLTGANTKFNNYHTYLDEIGYPENSRNISISNGNDGGQGLELENGNFFVNYYCHKNPVGDILRINVFPSPGIISFNHIYHPDGILDLNGVHIEQIVPSNNFEQYNLAPGGLRNSIQEFVDEINENLPNADLPGTCSQTIQSHMYNPNHTFVSTASALGLDISTYLNSDIETVLENNPSLLPFDNYYSPSNWNEPHSQVNELNANFILHNVINGEYPLDEELTSNSLNNGTFNLADPIHKVLKGIDIYNNGSLFINSPLPINYGFFSEYEFNANVSSISQPSAHKKVRTSSCDNPHVAIYNGGRLELGEITGNRTAELDVTDGSEIHILADGTFVINPGSTLRIKNGATLDLNGGELIIQNGGKLILEHGSIFEYEGNIPIQLNGSSSAIDISGDIYIADNSTFSVSHYAANSGVIRFQEGTNYIYGSSSSQISLIGDGEEDEFIEIMPGGEIRVEVNFGLFEIKKAKVVMREHARIVSAADFNAVDVHFKYDLLGANCSGSDCDNRGLSLWNSATIRLSILEDTPIDFYDWQSNIQIAHSDIVGSDSDITIYHGGYDLNVVEFTEGARLEGDETSRDSSVKNTRFTDGFLSDDGVRDVKISFSRFNNSPILKSRGEIQLKCVQMKNADRALTLEESSLKTSVEEGLGYNKFFDNDTHILCYEAINLGLNGGENSFGVSDLHIEGSLAGNCSDAINCGLSLNASWNNWGTSGTSNNSGTNTSSCLPESDMFDLWVHDEQSFCNVTNISSGKCQVDVFDRAPICTWRGCNLDRPRSSESTNEEDEENEAQAISKTEVNSIKVLEILAYPNPSSKVFTIEVEVEDKDQIINYELYNSIGALVTAGKIFNGKTEIDLSDQARGVYTLIANNYDSRKTIRLIKE